MLVMDQPEEPMLVLDKDIPGDAGNETSLFLNFFLFYFIAIFFYLL